MYGQFGWNTGFHDIMPRGHEILTERALGMASASAPGSVTINVRGRPIVTELNAQETRAIVEGNRAVDVADLANTQRLLRSRPLQVASMVLPGPAAALVGSELVGHVVHSAREAEQKLHSLRRNPGQDWRVALREIVAELDGQYRGIVAERDAGRRLWRIGTALHLVQDSYCPAHTQRSREGCITYVRNYGGYDTPLWQRGGPNREHRFPTDARDSVAAHPGEANAAVQASREFLQIVFKAIYGKQPAPGAGPDIGLVNEAYEDFRRFVQRHFRPC